MNSTLNINYCYYNNYDLFSKVVKYYSPLKNDPKYHFTVIDDGSQEQPLTKSNIPSWWTCYRVDKDYGWGNETCRNLLMKLTPYSWNALIDMEFVVDLYSRDSRHDITYITDQQKLLYKAAIMYFPLCRLVDIDNDVLIFNDRLYNTRPEDTLVNSFIISKQTFDTYTFGYDMAFAWMYGNDTSLIDQVDSIIFNNARLLQIADYGSWGPQRYETIDGYDKTLYRFEQIEKLAADFVLTKKIKVVDGTYIWNSENLRHTCSKPLPPYRTLNV